MKIKRVYFKDAIYISPGEAITTLEPEKANAKTKITAILNDSGLLIEINQSAMLIPIYNIKQVIYDSTPEGNTQGVSKKAASKAGVPEPLSN